MSLSAFQDHAITAHVQVNTKGTNPPIHQTLNKIYLQIFPYEKAYERQKTAYPPKENVIKIVGFNPYE
ncbi:unnamed protein product [Schistosoma haematobium]|nr:unnamed protein product [Schistosoma haematobium]CAH8477801.1 unnamed protein product [Schistosoma haematobium]